MACGGARLALHLTTRHLYLILWFTINFAVFWSSYVSYKQRPQHFYVRSMLGRGLCISRGSAAVLNLNCGLVLLPVCRGLNSILYRILNRLSRKLLTHWLANLKTIHITLALTIVVSSLIHTTAHVVNAYNFSHHYNAQFAEINWAKYKGQSPTLMVLTSVAGVSGVAMVILLLLMLLLSLKYIRDLYYDLFWGSHFMFLPFLCLLVIHPFSGVLKEQTNYHEHKPGCYKPSNFNQSSYLEGSGVCTADPVFKPMANQGWLWVTVSLCTYVFDFLFRLFRRNNNLFIISHVSQLPGNVCQVTLSRSTMKKPFIVKPGQYVLLQCSKISSLEWHPFTVTSTTSSSSHTSFTVLIRKRGDWTRSVCKMINYKGGDRILPRTYVPIRLLVDGPFCSPLECTTKCRVAICIAAGIGITPFAALLDYLVKSNSTKLSRPHRIHLVWTVRACEHLVWASKLIATVHQKFWCLNQPDRLQVSLFVTRNYSYETLQECLLNESQFLLHRTNPGRPVWNQLFNEWANIYDKQEVTILLCGPPSLTKEVKQQCDKFNKQGSSFQYIEETFS